MARERFQRRRRVQVLGSPSSRPTRAPPPQSFHPSKQQPARHLRLRTERAGECERPARQRPTRKGASIYDVRSGWGERGPQKADERNKICRFVTATGGGVKKSENLSDIIYGSPLRGRERTEEGESGHEDLGVRGDRGEGWGWGG